MDKTAFRKAFPEFSDIARYPDGQLDFYAILGEAQVNARRWKLQTAYGVMLYVAHEMTLASQNERTAIAGGTPGQSSGPVNSKTVGSVTVAYDTQQGAERDGGWWNLTIYGKQFLRLVRIFGSGVVVV